MPDRRLSWYSPTAGAQEQSQHILSSRKTPYGRYNNTRIHSGCFWVLAYNRHLYQKQCRNTQHSPSPSSHHPANISNSCLRAIGACPATPLLMLPAARPSVGVPNDPSPGDSFPRPWWLTAVPGVRGSDTELLLLFARCTVGASRIAARGRVMGPTSSWPMQRHTAHRQYATCSSTHSEGKYLRLVLSMVFLHQEAVVADAMHGHPCFHACHTDATHAHTCELLYCSVKHTVSHPHRNAS